MCLHEKCNSWLNDPDKKNWFRLFKFLLTLIRGVLFLVFISLSIYYSTPYWQRQSNQTLIFPMIAFVCILVFNWRFIISIGLLLLMLTIRLIELASTCMCIGCVINRYFKRMRKLLKSSLTNLNWSQLDWPCFLNLKYYIYYLDAFHYLAYLVTVIVVFLVELLSREATNMNLLIVFVVNVVPFFAHLVIEIYRIIKSKRVQQTIRDIFHSDLAFSHKAKAMISEDQLDSCVCVADLTTTDGCSLLDSHHRALSHPKQAFTRNFHDVPYKKRGVNLTIGFHQTTIEASRSILTNGFRPSKSGMLGPGIYFATNYAATDFKRNQSTEGGAIFCAVIDMARVCEIYEKSDDQNYSQHFNSKYLRHGAGDLYDEFVVYSESQIVEYTIIVEQKAIDSYRERNKRECCNCI